MKSMIEKVFSIKALVALMIICATSGTWADTTLSSSGFVPSGEANKTAVFSGVTLSDINSGKYVLVGKLGGGNVNNKGGQALAYSYTLSSGTLTVIFQRVDDGHCKCVEVKLTEDSGTIYAYASRAGYLTGGQPGLSASQINWWGTVVTSNSSAGYGIYDICLSKPGSSATITNQSAGNGNGVGNIAASDTYTLQLVADSPFSSGGYVRLNSFAFGMNSSSDALNAKYVTCVDYKGDTITSAIANGTGNVQTSTKFSNNSLKQSYAFGAVGSTTECIVKVGTSYAFGPQDGNGTNVLQRVYCKKTTDRTYSPVAQSASMAAEWRMTQELKATVLTSLETSTGGNWSELPFVDAPTTEWSNSSYAPVILVVTDDCTITLDTAVSVDSIIFDVAAGKTLTLAGSNTITASNGIYVRGGTVAMTSSLLLGTVYGNGTLYYNGVRPTTSGTDVILTNDVWRGTVRITYNKENTATGGARALFPQYWGGANSKIKWNGVAGYFGGCTSTAGWILENLTVDATDYPALRKNDGGSNSTTTAPSLEGDGEFADASGPSERFHFTTGSSFAGKINITSSAGYGMNVQFGETAVDKVAGTIHVLSGATMTVAANKTWAAPGGIVVNGTLNVGSGATIPAIASGSTGIVQIASAGTATISGVKDNAISAKLIMYGGNIAVADTGVTELTIPAENNVTFYAASGKLDLSTCTSLTTLKLNLGSATTFDLANVTLPASCTTVLVDVGSGRDLTGYSVSNLGTATLGFSVTETKEEYANGTFSVANVPSGATVSVVRANGTTSAATVTDGTARFADYGTVKISGAATDLDLTCDDESIAFDYTSINGAGTNRDNEPVYTEDGVYARANVYTTGSGVGTFLVNNSAAMTLAVVGSMSPTANTIFLSLGGSNTGFNGIVLVRTSKTDEVVIGYNEEGVVHKIAEMTVPNCATARHVYIITKEDDGANSVFTVYLDGIKWKTLTISKLTFVGGGIQIGADFHGGIRGDSQSEFGGAAFVAIPNNESETGVLNAMRVYGRVITPAEIAAYTSAFPYVSPNGSSARTFTAASENWIDETPGSEVWENSTGGNSGTPLTGAALNVTANVETEVTVNLASETTYEALTIGGAATTFVPGGNGGDVKVTGMTVIGTTVTNQYGAVDMSGGPMTITQDGDITFDYSAYDISAIYTTTDIPLTSDVDEDSTKVHLIAPSASYRTASLVYTSKHYAMRVTPDHEAGTEVYYKSGYFGKGGDSPFTVVLSDGTTPTVVFEGDTVVIDDKSSQDPIYIGELPDNVEAIRVARTYSLASGNASNAMLDGAVVTVADGVVLTIQYNWNSINLGSVVFNKVGDSGTGSVAFDNNGGTLSISGAITGTAPITIAAGKTVTLASTGSIANTIDVHGTLVVKNGATFPEGAAITGDGRVVFEQMLPASNLLTSLQDSSSWTGTVELKNYTQTTEIDAHKIINFGNYGNSSSTVALNGVTSTMYTGNSTYPDVTLGAIEIGEGGWSDNDGLNYSVSPLYTANLTGNGTITVKTGYDGTVRFVGNHTFAGSVAFGANTGKQVAFMKTASDTLPSVAAGAIVVAGRSNMSIASGKTWTAPGGIKIDGKLTVLTAQAATATSVTPTAYLDGASLTTTADGEAGTTTYVTDEVTQISDNQATLGAVTVSEPMRMTGSGGAYMSSLTINDGATLTYDPVITPLRVESAPVFNGSGKLKLAARYAGVTRGKFHLVTYPSESFNEYSEEALKALVDSSSFNNETYTVTEETVGSYKQLVLTVGDYDTNAKPVSIAQFGDSITEGIWRSGYRGTPNYRIPLMQLLEAYGYKPEARGYRSVGSTDANGIPADDNYKWHTGISAQRIYTGLTGTSLRAGFMESIEAHLEQVGVTDIITLKIGTNDSIGNETADNMFEGWTNLVWKIARMRPTSKIVVCAPVKIRSGEKNAPGLRTKIADYVAKTAAQGGFPDGQVTMINGIEIVTDDANYYLTDNVHPNWNGHLQLANAWLPAVTNAFESMTARAADAYTAQPAVDSAESVAALADYREGYVKLATFTNVWTKLSTWSESPYYYVNDAYKDIPMDRVAYFVARKTTTSPDTRYVWVDMDADGTTGTTLAEFGVPTSASVNVVVTNLHIYSNSSAIENVAPNVSGVKGTLMRTEKGVNKANGISTDFAPDGPYGFDWNDSINGSGAWGVMNMARIFDGATPTDHRKLLAAQMLFDFNGFSGSMTNALGIGNFAVHGPYNTANGSVDHFNLNWTFTTAKDAMPTMDATALETGVIEIWGKPPTIENGEDEPVGYMYGTTAVITNTTSAVTIPASATAVAAQPTTNSFVIVASQAQLETSNFLTLTAKYGVSGVQDITSAFVPQIIGGDASAAQVRLTLTGSQTVSVDEEPISVTPTLRAGNSDPVPMAYDAESGNPKFNIKAIPGLYYAVKAYSLPDCEDEDLVEAGSATQATSATVSPVAPAIGAYTVQYYKISVGLSAAEARQ